MLAGVTTSCELGTSVSMTLTLAVEASRLRAASSDLGTDELRVMDRELCWGSSAVRTSACANGRASLLSHCCCAAWSCAQVERTGVSVTLAVRPACATTSSAVRRLAGEVTPMCSCAVAGSNQLPPYVLAMAAPTLLTTSVCAIWLWTSMASLARAGDIPLLVSAAFSMASSELGDGGLVVAEAEGVGNRP